jgi:hypothetical protein
VSDIVEKTKYSYFSKLKGKNNSKKQKRKNKTHEN